MTRFAKFLWYVLGVRPEEFGLVLDPQGFVKIKALLQALREEPGWSFLGRGHLAELVHSPEGQRFEFTADAVRAKDPMTSVFPDPVPSPPRRLFHAVRRRGHAVAMEQGLRPSKGPWVVMAATAEMALRIGKRRDPNPVILEVKAEDASRRGVRFHGTEGILFLAQFVPPEFLAGPPPAPLDKAEPKRKPKDVSTQESPGSFFLDLQRDLGGEKTSRRRDREPPWKRQRRRGKG